MSEQPDPQLETQTRIPFLTDEGILRELQMLDNGLAHLEAEIPSMRRRVSALRRELEPRGESV
jgi:hypothetical protein